MLSELAQYKDVLENCTLFKEIDIDKIDGVLQCLSPTIKKYNSGTYIAIEGDDSPGTCIILSGEVSIIKSTISGETNIINTLKESDIFGEIPAFSNEGKWPASVIARKDSTIMIIPANNFINRCSNHCVYHNKLTENMLLILSDKILQLNKKNNYLTLRSLRAKISTYLLELQKKHGSSTFNLNYTRNELANFFCVARPSLSRELSNLKNEGIIDLYRSSVKILKPDVLFKYTQN